MSKVQKVDQQFDTFKKDKEVGTDKIPLEERLLKGKARLEVEAIGGKLYSAECQKVGVQLPDEIVDSFKNHEEYVQTFQPFIYEETRESMRHRFNESCSGSQSWPVYISSLIPKLDGWVSLDVRPQHEHKYGLKEGSMVILLSHRPPNSRDLQRQYRGGAFEWAQQMLKTSILNKDHDKEKPKDQESYYDKGMEDFCILPGIIRSHYNVNSFQKDTLIVDVHPQCDEHQSLKDNSKYLCSKVLSKLMKNPKQWWLVICGNLTSFQREYETLIHFRNLDLMSESVLDPYTAFQTVDYSFEKNWPEELTTPEFMTWIGTCYDQSQLEAIRKASAHLPHTEFTAEAAVQNQQQGSRKTLAEQFRLKQEKQKQLEGSQEEINQQFENIQNNYQYTRFTLIQGPPGTGKTYTIQGILNVWHITQYQRLYNKVMQTIVERLEKITNQKKQAMENGAKNQADFQNMIFADRVEIEQILEESQLINIKPHILVCAPSNAATDELLERILKSGFRDANAAVYRPNILRVGSEDAPLSYQARMVWVDQKVQTLMQLNFKDYEQQFQYYNIKSREKSDELYSYYLKFQECSNSELQNTDPAALQQRKDDLARNLMRCKEDLDKINLEIYRLDTISGRFYDNFNPREAREKIELSFIDKADMVLTTLSSSGRRTLSNSKNPFTMVLIDEACQAQEVACLQPLIYGCKKCVLVGDPQQLPSTVLSQSSKERLLERSLFERLSKKGAIPHLLQVQYRMHPEIRYFPSKYFYHNQLMDAPPIVKMCLERKEVLNHMSFHKHHLLKPYVFFNVEKGYEQKHFSKSLQNQAEADLACGLFMELREHLIKENQERVSKGMPGVPLTQVGVITPYKQQRTCILQTFERILGVQVAQEVKIETVDSYQGKQMDVIILSCVRASLSSGTVGFVADVRRMNVAITRAKKSLWILGNCGTLKQDENWNSLIQDAEQRGTIINDADAWDLFPKLRQVYKQSQENEIQERGGANNNTAQHDHRPRNRNHPDRSQRHDPQSRNHGTSYQKHYKNPHHKPQKPVHQSTTHNQNNHQNTQAGNNQLQVPPNPNKTQPPPNQGTSKQQQQEPQQQEHNNKGHNKSNKEGAQGEVQNSKKEKQDPKPETQQQQKVTQIKRNFSENKPKSKKATAAAQQPAKIDISQAPSKKKTPTQIALEIKNQQQSNLGHQVKQQIVEQEQLNPKQQNDRAQAQVQQLAEQEIQILDPAEQEAADYEILKSLQYQNKKVISPKEAQNINQPADIQSNILQSKSQQQVQQQDKQQQGNRRPSDEKQGQQPSQANKLKQPQKVVNKEKKQASAIKRQLLKKSSIKNDAIPGASSLKATKPKESKQDLLENSPSGGLQYQSDDKAWLEKEDADFKPAKKRAGLFDDDDYDVELENTQRNQTTKLRNQNKRGTQNQPKTKKTLQKLDSDSMVQQEPQDLETEQEGEQNSEKELPKVRKEATNKESGQQTKKQKQGNSMKRELESLTKGMNLDSTPTGQRAGPSRRGRQQQKGATSESQDGAKEEKASDTVPPNKKNKRKQ